MGERIKRWIADARRDVVVLYLAARDPRVPWHAKGLALATVAYAFSPIDLIPDFIPVLGLLDDLIILPLAIWLAVKLIPAEVMEDLRAQAERRIADKSRSRPRNWAGAIIVIGLWLALAVAIWFALTAAHE